MPTKSEAQEISKSSSQGRDENCKIPKVRETYHRWSHEEKKKHLQFMKNNIDLFSLKENYKKRNLLFFTMAEFIVTKDNIQCRTHHVKVFIKYGGEQKNILLVIQRLENELSQKEQAKHKRKSTTLKENSFSQIQTQTKNLTSNLRTRSEISELKKKEGEIVSSDEHRQNQASLDLFSEDWLLELLNPQKNEQQHDEYDKDTKSRPNNLPYRSVDQLSPIFREQPSFLSDPQGFLIPIRDEFTDEGMMKNYQWPFDLL